MRKPVDPEEQRQMIQSQRNTTLCSGYPDDPKMRANLLTEMQSILNSPNWQVVDTNPLRQLLLANSPLVSSSSVENVVADPVFRLR